MPITLDQFVKCLADSGVMPADEVSSFQDSLPPYKRPKDAQDLARQLVLAGKLTRYQAALLYQSRAKGLIVGQYLVLDKIGAGGMGQVFKAQHRNMKRIVALKVLPSSVSESSQAVKRFQREVQAAARLVHPNIVTAYDADEAGGVRFLVMEFVDGPDLASLCKKNHPLPAHHVVHYIVQAARGLEFAHSQGVVHRDIKPGNLLVDKSGAVKILDMGLARLDEIPSDGGPAERLTHRGTVIGTPDYMAPEQAEDAHSADLRADIYSLGCTLFALLAGRSIYGGETVMVKLMNHREMPIPLLRTVRPELSLELDEIFQRMVAKDKTERYQSMTEVIRDLERAISHGVAQTDDAPPAPPVLPAQDERLSEFFQGLPQSSSNAARSVGEAQASGMGGSPSAGSSAASPDNQRSAGNQRFLAGAPQSMTAFTMTEKDKPASHPSLTGASVSKVAPLFRKGGWPLWTAAGIGVVAAAAMILWGVLSLQSAPATRDRFAAEWVLKMGGRVSVVASGENKPFEVEVLDELPKAAFVLRRVDLKECDPVGQAGLANLNGLIDLTRLDVSGTDLDDDDLKELDDLESLRTFDLSGTLVTAQGVEDIKRRFPQTKVIH